MLRQVLIMRLKEATSISVHIFILTNNTRLIYIYNSSTVTADLTELLSQ